MGANGIDSMISNEEVDTREDNLLANRGCKFQMAKIITPLPREVIHKAENESLVNRTIPCCPCVKGVFLRM